MGKPKYLARTNMIVVLRGLFSPASRRHLWLAGFPHASSFRVPGHGVVIFDLVKHFGSTGFIAPLPEGMLKTSADTSVACCFGIFSVCIRL